MRITTAEQFWIAAETWYQRTHRLREVAESETETPERKSKALKLFMIMMGKMQIVSRMAFEMEQPKFPSEKFKQGSTNKVDYKMN